MQGGHKQNSWNARAHTHTHTHTQAYTDAHSEIERARDRDLPTYQLIAPTVDVVITRWSIKRAGQFTCLSWLRINLSYSLSYMNKLEDRATSFYVCLFYQTTNEAAS